MNGAKLHILGDLPLGQQQEIAEDVANYSQVKATEQLIVPVAAKEVLQKQIGVVALDSNILAGYVGATAIWDDNRDEQFMQIGTLMVPEPYQGQGIGCRLVAKITGLAINGHFTPFAFCNPGSKPAFEAAGYTDGLPYGISSPYGNQPTIYTG